LEHTQFFCEETNTKQNQDDSSHANNITVLLVFSITNYCNGDEHLNIRRKSYIFVQKKFKELEKLGDKNGKGGYLIDKDNSEVYLLVGDFQLIKVKFSEIRNWQLQSQNENQHEHQDSFSNHKDKNYKYKDIHLTFENDFDKDEESGLLPFIYQEYFNPNNNRLLCYNIMKNEIEIEIIANP
jgi:hypothetical protein